LAGSTLLPSRSAPSAAYRPSPPPLVCRARWSRIAITCAADGTCESHIVGVLRDRLVAVGDDGDWSGHAVSTAMPDGRGPAATVRRGSRLIVHLLPDSRDGLAAADAVGCASCRNRGAASAARRRPRS